MIYWNMINYDIFSIGILERNPTGMSREDRNAILWVSLKIFSLCHTCDFCATDCRRMEETGKSQHYTWRMLRKTKTFSKLNCVKFITYLYWFSILWFYIDILNLLNLRLNLAISFACLLVQFRFLYGVNLHMKQYQIPTGCETRVLFSILFTLRIIRCR